MTRPARIRRDLLSTCGLVLLCMSTFPTSLRADDAGQAPPDAGTSPPEDAGDAARADAPEGGDGPSDAGAAPADAGPLDDASSAEDGGAPETDAAPAKLTITPPKLIEFISAPYPEAALKVRAEGEVVLKLLVAADGTVAEAEVSQGLGFGLDEAARDAALRFRFEPARRGDTPFAARILYAYEFRLPKPSPAPVAATPPPPEKSPSFLEVNVQGQTEADKLRESAQAVVVVETKEAKTRTADLGEVLARTQGVGVRRSGGLGSLSRFSLNGLTDDQIRFFYNGVPMELAGYPMAVADFPVNLVDRVDIYRGVVPVVLGADALGGAVNLVTDDAVRGTHGAWSYMAGSFGTHRATLRLRHLHEPSGFFVRVGGFFDYTDNDYPIDVEVPDERGRLSPARVYRFHDAYRAQGSDVEVGFVERPWAKRLVLRGFANGYTNELQHNIVMSVPYGDVEYGERIYGTSLRYENVFREHVTLDAIAGYSYSRYYFQDMGECVYDWFGQCVRERRSAGEIESPPRNERYWDRVGYARSYLEWRIQPRHALQASVAPTYLSRTGDELLQINPDARDPLTAARKLSGMVAGIAYKMNLFGDRLENIAFVKGYLQHLDSEEPLPGGAFRQRQRTTRRGGVGNSVRYRFVDWFYAKASYEWATRLPRPDEIFGDAALTLANLEIKPELSHNVNLQLTVDAKNTPAGGWRLDVNGFLRETDQLIVYLGNDRTFTYQNVFGARAIGVEAAAGWTSPGDYLTLDANATYLDFRNTSSEGTFGDFKGDRIPNRPWLFSNAYARGQLRDVATAGDELSLTWNLRYVYEVFRGWESVGLREFKQVLPSQLTHALGIIYSVQGDPLALSFVGEVHNVTDAEAYDYYGVVRPGRSFFFKTTGSF